MALETSRSTAFLFKIIDTTPKTLQNFGMFDLKSFDNVSTMQRNPMLEALQLLAAATAANAPARCSLAV
jgi:hypothetical protein